MRLYNILEDLEQKMSPLLRKLSKLNKDQQTRLSRILKINGSSPDLTQIIRAANTYDPTDQKATYTYWIIKVLTNSGLRLPDDAERLTSTLAFFDRIKKSPRFTDEKDINRYETFRDFEQIITKYQNLGSEKPTSIRQWE